MAGPLKSLFCRAQHDQPEHRGRRVHWLAALCVLILLFCMWLTVYQFSSSRRVKYIPKLPDSQEHESFPMPHGHLDRG